MEWFEGSIGEAIQTAKMSKSIFVVVVHGSDDEETSKKFLEVLNDKEISSKNPTQLVSKSRMVANLALNFLKFTLLFWYPAFIS